MALGRYVRSRAKVQRASFRRSVPKRLPVVVEVDRQTTAYDSAGYFATACIGGRSIDKAPSGAPSRIQRGGCAIGTGRTPQAAIAKALKALAGTVASRGRAKKGSRR